MEWFESGYNRWFTSYRPTSFLGRVFLVRSRKNFWLEFFEEMYRNVSFVFGTVYHFFREWTEGVRSRCEIVDSTVTVPCTSHSIFAIERLVTSLPSLSGFSYLFSFHLQFPFPGELGRLHPWSRILRFLLSFRLFWNKFSKNRWSIVSLGILFSRENFF